jgi:hypothetical protein
MLETMKIFTMHAAYKKYVLWQHEKIRKWEQENDSKLLCYSNTETISFSKWDIL